MPSLACDQPWEALKSATAELWIFIVFRRHVAEGHVVEHALPKRRNRLAHWLDSLF
jgi:hypothetical protein